MSVVVIDAATREKFLAADGEVVEVRDETAVVGRFIRHRDIDNCELIERPLTHKVIERYDRRSRTYTAGEVAQRLRNLRKRET